ncbi:MAG: glycosyltransferase, partial [Gemmatimonadaceae bacterium]
VYPPVSAKPGAGGAGGAGEAGGAGGAGAVRGEYLLHLGRLVPYKRVDLAIAAAERLGVRLIVAGDGPDRPRLERLAGPQTTFVGEVSEEEAGRLLSGCAAFVFCAEEDFGIAPLEANAHGAPVVGLARGGLLETMVPGQTAELFQQPTVDELSAAIERALVRHWPEATLRANAARFSPQRFRAAFLDSVTSALPAPLVERR